MLRSPSWIVLALPLAACVTLNDGAALLDGSTDSGASDSALVPDAAAPDAPTRDAAADLPPPLDGPSVDTAPPPDATPAECTPQAIGCAPDGRTVRTCSAQGRWVATTTCAAQTACSGGLCLCSPEVCDEGSIHQIAAMPGRLVRALAGGGGSLFVGVDGTQSSIRRIDLQSQAETVVQMGDASFTAYALDSDPMGNLIWCSDVHPPTAQTTGDVFSGTIRLDTGSCTEVRRRDNLVYYKRDFLYRTGLDGSARQMVTSEAMGRFEVTGDAVYFVTQAGKDGNDGVLKKLSLSALDKVDTMVTRPDTLFRTLLVDASQVYVMTEDEILRVPQAAGGMPESFFQNAVAQVWAMAQTDSHVYWSTTTTAAAGCSQAQVWRKPKSAGPGGPAAVMSTFSGRCAGELVVVGQYLYTALGVDPPGAAATEIHRLRL